MLTGIIFAMLLCMGFSTYVYAEKTPPVTINVALKKGESRALAYRKGQSIRLRRYGLQIKRATYKSSNPSVASVSATGTVKLKKPGKTIISVTARGMHCKYKLKVTKKSTMYDLANKYSRQMKYFILLDRGQRRVYILKRIMGEYVLLKKYPCCVGAPGTPTPKGSYSIRGKGDYFVTDGGNKCWYYSQIVGSVMFHSQIYSSANSPSVLVDGSMGVACSHGCVRLYLKDAKWIHDTIPYGTRVYIV